jgi:hypothetical protein
MYYSKTVQRSEIKVLQSKQETPEPASRLFKNKFCSSRSIRTDECIDQLVY